MREMDILLQRFLERGYDAMSPDERIDFERLLDLPDQDILRWLLGEAHDLPADEGLAVVVRRIRQVVSGP
jgi:antitoxin CptB